MIVNRVKKDFKMLSRDSSIDPSIGQFRFTSALKSVAKVISGNIAANLITMLTSILIARWTNPSDMGVWNAVLLVTLYAPVMQLGVFNGLNRELPYLIGNGEKQRALQMAEAAYALTGLLMAVSLVCGALIAIWYWTQGQPLRCYTTIAVAVMIGASWPTIYLTTTYRTNSDFGRLAQNSVLVALLGVIFALLVWRYHFNGLIVRAALLSVLGVAALYYRRPLPVKPQWNTHQLIHLVKVGIPIYVIGQLATLFMSLDRAVLVNSTEALGYFTIAIQVGAGVRMIPIAFTTVLYPQMAHRYGESHCAMDIWRIARNGAIAASGIGLVLGVCGWLALPTFVRLVLPKYLPGTRAAQCSAFLALTMGMYVFDNIYNVIRRQELYFINWCFGGASFFAAWLCLTRVLHVSLTVASSVSMLVATLLMATISVFVSRRACLAHDRA